MTKSSVDPLISVIIVSYNTSSITTKCIDSVLASSGFSKDEIEIILVDNNSSDDTVLSVTKNYKTVKIIKNKSNLGFGEANNIGIKRSSAPHILLLNSDAFLQPDTLHKLYKMHLKHSPLATAPVLKNEDGSLQPSAGHFPTLIRILGWMFYLDRLPLFNSLIGQYHIKEHNYYTKTSHPDWVTGACILFTQNNLSKVGYFDSKIFMYAEELELFIRLNKKFNKKCLLITNTYATHLGSFSSKNHISTKLTKELLGVEYIYKKHYNQHIDIVKGILRLGAFTKMLLYSLLPSRKSDYEEYKNFLSKAR